VGLALRLVAGMDPLTRPATADETAVAGHPLPQRGEGIFINCPPATAHCLLPAAYCGLPTAFCLLPSAYCLPADRPKWSFRAAWAAK